MIGRNTHLAQTTFEGVRSAWGLAHDPPPVDDKLNTARSALTLFHFLDGTLDFDGRLDGQVKSVECSDAVASKDCLGELGSISKREEEVLSLGSESMNPSLDLDSRADEFGQLVDLGLIISARPKGVWPTYLLCLLRRIIDQHDALGLLSPFRISLLLLLLLTSELVAVGGRFELLLPPDFNTLHQLLLTALTELDPFVPLHRVWFADEKVRGSEWVGIGRCGRLQRLVRSEGGSERRELGTGAGAVRSALLVDVEVGEA